MTVRRIVANIASDWLDLAQAFYGDVLGMRRVMNQGWIITFAGEGSTAPQLSIASQGGNGTPVPDLSIEVDDVDAVHDRCRTAGAPIEYGPVEEAWGVRRFFVRDPFGRLLNVLAHLPASAGG